MASFSKKLSSVLNERRLGINQVLLFLLTSCVSDDYGVFM